MVCGVGWGGARGVREMHVHGACSVLAVCCCCCVCGLDCGASSARCDRHPWRLAVFVKDNHERIHAAAGAPLGAPLPVAETQRRTLREGCTLGALPLGVQDDRHRAASAQQRRRGQHHHRGTRRPGASGRKGAGGRSILAPLCSHRGAGASHVRGRASVRSCARLKPRRATCASVRATSRRRRTPSPSFARATRCGVRDSRPA